jgi:hypothetical protein
MRSLYPLRFWSIRVFHCLEGAGMDCVIVAVPTAGRFAGNTVLAKLPGFD